MRTLKKTLSSNVKTEKQMENEKLKTMKTKN